MLRELGRLGLSALVLLSIMLGASLLLWVGVPLGWLWIGSQIEGSGGSLGEAMAAMLVGATLTVIAVACALGWLSGLYRRLRIARGLEDTGHFALEVVMVVSATIAAVCFTAWFFLFAGSSPIPIGIGV